MNRETSEKVYGAKIVITKLIVKELIGDLDPLSHKDDLLLALDFSGGIVELDNSTEDCILTIQHPDLPEVIDGIYTEIVPIYACHDYGIPAKRIYERIEPKKGNL